MTNKKKFVKENKFSTFKKNYPLSVNSIKDLEYFNHMSKTNPFATFGETVDKNDPWYYDLNELGLRGELYKNKELKCAFFGCSFTFGQGVKFEETWPYIVGETFFSNSWINFGQMGASFRHISDLFIAVSKIYDIKNAIFLLPPFERTKILTRNDDCCQYYSILPQVMKGDREYQDAKKFYRNYNELEHFQLFMDNVIKIELNAQLKNIKLIWSTVDEMSMQALEALDISCIPWNGINFIDTGRDKSHPGPISHKRLAEKIISYIKQDSI